MYYCQRCGKKNETDGVNCSFCGTLQQTGQPDSETKACKRCAKKIPVNANFCYYCGMDQAKILWQERQPQEEKDEAKDRAKEQAAKAEQQQDIPTIKINDPKKLRAFLKLAQKDGLQVHVLGKNESLMPGLITSTKLFVHDWLKVNKRMGRADFWLGLLGTFLLSVPVGICLSLCVSLVNGLGPQAAETVFKAGLAAWLAFFYVALLTGLIRRLHDIELPAYLALLLFIPGGGDLAALVIAALPQHRKKNTYTFEEPGKKGPGQDHGAK